jgi:hypothetical protein
MALKQLGQFDEHWIARVTDEAERLGQSRRMFVQRAVDRALEATLSEANGAMSSEQAGPAPVPTTTRTPGSQSVGVRPAASLRAHPETCRCGVCTLTKPKR